MRFANLRWLAFLVYVVVSFATAPGLLWGLTGLMGGGLVGLSFLFALRFRAMARLELQRESKPLTVAEAPREHRVAEEYCRRLGIAKPSLRVIETAGVNIGVYGFSGQHQVVVFTRGLLQSWRRELVNAVIARALCRIWTGEVPNETWLTRLFEVVYRLDALFKSGRRPAPLQTAAAQILLYPLTLFPCFVLKSSVDENDLDLKSTRMTQNPRALSEAYRRLDASAERTPCRVPFGARHLFLSSPHSMDPLARLFFSTSSFAPRIKAVESLFRTANAQ
jgi:hypothetical protein